MDAVLGAKREITLMNDKKLLVKIPPGIETGKKLRFAGAGEPGVGKAPAGDVYVDVLVRPSPIFSRTGNDLEMELPVSLTEAIFGGEVEIPALDQPVILKIPPGVNTGTRLRIKEKGGVDPAHKTRGNLILILKVILLLKLILNLKKLFKNGVKPTPMTHEVINDRRLHDCTKTLQDRESRRGIRSRNKHHYTVC